MALDPAPLIAWLIDRDARRYPVDRLIAELAARLGAQGVALSRVVTSVPTKHPEVYVRFVEWSDETGAAVNNRPRNVLGLSTYLDSPVAALHRGVARVRCRLAGPDADLSYPVCRDLAARGATDYLALALDLGADVRSYISFTTRRADGFDDAELALLEALAPALELRLEPEATRYTLRSLLEVYLGPNAAARVLAGDFQRGGGELIRAAIWFCDMRGFTTLADRAPPGEVVATLDRFFEALGEPITSGGGEILKFIGDAALAIFPAGDDPRDACRRALVAAEAARAAVARLPAGASGSPPELGIALHLGEVMYGNIGARERLDFTVIGAAVNEVCRVEALCKSLGESILVTATFAATAGVARVRSLGRHALRGVAESAEIYALAPDGPDAHGR